MRFVLLTSSIVLLVSILTWWWLFNHPDVITQLTNDEHEDPFPITFRIKQAIKNDLLRYSLLQEQREQNDKLTVAIGYNSNVDLVVKAIPVLNQLLLMTTNTTSEISDGLLLNAPSSSSLDEESYCNALFSVQQFVHCFVRFFREGSGVERFVLNETMFEQVISTSVLQEDNEFHIGGNAALMAVKFAKEQWKRVFLTGGTIGDRLRQLLAQYSNKIQFVTHESLNSKQEHSDEKKDEIHLIMEYDKNEEFAGYFAPRANRFIVTRDISNAEFYSLDQFHRVIDQNIRDIDLVVLSGFHLLDGETNTTRREHMMQRISEKIAKTFHIKEHKKKHFMMHLELASIGQEKIYNEIGKYIFPYIHSIGLNEQELSSLYRATHSSLPKLKSIAQVIPNIAQVTIALSHVMKTFGSIERIHFHSLAYHLLVVRQNNSNTAANLAAVSSSSLAACSQACGFDDPNDIEPEKVDVLFHWEEQQPIIQKFSHLFSRVHFYGAKEPSMVQWTNDGFEFFLAPVLVCKKTIKTVGLGDAISTAGLSAQLKVEQHRRSLIH